MQPLGQSRVETGFNSKINDRWEDQMNYDLGFKDGKLFVSINLEKEGLGMINLEVDIELIAIMKIASESTDNKIDDYIVDLVKKALGK